jgi:hypothetical protein
MLAGIRLLRRIGLAVGAWFFVLYAGFFIGQLVQGQGFTNSYNWTMAAGATIFAFFLPRVEASSFTESDKESA